MLVILLLMITVATLSAFAAPIGQAGVGVPPLRMTPGQPAAPTQAPAAPSTPAPAIRMAPAPGTMPRGSLLNLSV